MIETIRTMSEVRGLASTQNGLFVLWIGDFFLSFDALLRIFRHYFELFVIADTLRVETWSVLHSLEDYWIYFRDLRSREGQKNYSSKFFSHLKRPRGCFSEISSSNFLLARRFIEKSNLWKFNQYWRPQWRCRISSDLFRHFLCWSLTPRGALSFSATFPTFMCAEILLSPFMWIWCLICVINRR